MDDRLKHYAKRLADYVRLAIETEYIKANSPVGIAYYDFIAEWNNREQEDAADVSKCTCVDEINGFQCAHCQEMKHRI